MCAFTFLKFYLFHCGKVTVSTWSSVIEAKHFLVKYSVSSFYNYLHVSNLEFLGLWIWRVLWRRNERFGFYFESLFCSQLFLGRFLLFWFSFLLTASATKIWYIMDCYQLVWLGGSKKWNFEQTVDIRNVRSLNRTTWRIPLFHK